MTIRFIRKFVDHLDHRYAYFQYHIEGRGAVTVYARNAKQARQLVLAGVGQK
ncbi:MAG: hypothetical protein K6T83_03720 [Alicyclobacillus sp.]|nr:hypothetical protein [Alicyclobacillus sp.]